jgi:hypothetical protein
LTDGRRRAWFSLGLVAMTALVYLPVRGHEFVSIDDNIYVRGNPHVADGLTWDAVRWAFTSGYAANWHPLTWISHMLDVSLFGMDAGAHHVVNLVLHVANTLLLFDVLRRMTGALGRSAFVAALFAVHPLHVESVAWVAERKDVLSTLFWMLTLEAYVAWTRAPNARRYALVLLAFVAGLLSKPMLVTLPFALLLLDAWPLRRMTDAASAKRLVVEKIPLFLLAAASSVVTFVAQHAEGAVASFETRPLAERLVNAPIAYVVYVRKMLAPTDLAPMYAQARPSAAGIGAAAAAALALVTWAAWRQARARPWFVVGWLWFLGTLVPVIGLVQVGWQTMADRYTYVPLVGLFVVVAWGAAELLAATARAGAATVVASAALVACAVLARRQVETWRDGETLWRHAVAVDPDNPAARNFLGGQMCFLERYDEAVAQFREMVRLTPESAEAHNNLAFALRSRGDLEGAAAEYSEALRRKPGLVEAREDLRLVLTQLGRVDEAQALGR